MLQIEIKIKYKIKQKNIIKNLLGINLFKKNSKVQLEFIRHSLIIILMKIEEIITI